MPKPKDLQLNNDIKRKENLQIEEDNESLDYCSTGSFAILRPKCSFGCCCCILIPNNDHLQMLHCTISDSTQDTMSVVLKP